MDKYSDEFSDEQYEADESFFAMFLESAQKPKQARPSVVSAPPLEDASDLELGENFLKEFD